MLRETDTFRFEVPDGWTDFRDGARFVCQGPGGEELILSSWIVTGGQPSLAKETAVDRLQANAEHAAMDAAQHPDLVVRSPLTKLPRTNPDCWVLHAETVDGTILFLEAVVRGDNAVLLATYEAPRSPGVDRPFVQFLDSLQTVR